jgi:hypothetical protein
MEEIKGRLRRILDGFVANWLPWSVSMTSKRREFVNPRSLRQ